MHRLVTRSRIAINDSLDRLLSPTVRQRLIWYVRPLLYRGDAVRCPCCGGEFSHFMAHRDVPNVRCPRCGSMERHRLLTLWLDRHPEFLSGVRRVLHMAPEPPLQNRLERVGDLEYITADLASRAAAVHCDIQDLPFRDGWFDLVVCNHVLEHVPDDRQAMRELHRVLAGGGRAILLCPIARDRSETLEDPTVTSPEQRLRVYGQEDHARLYGSDYADRLRDAGFELSIEHFLQSLDESTVRRHALARAHARDMFELDDLYLGRKG